MNYIKRMADIESRFHGVWKEISLNDSLTFTERRQFAVWDYPVADKYTKLWANVQKAGMPSSIDEAIARIRNQSTTDFALIGDSRDIDYLTMVNCELIKVGDDFAKRAYAIGLPHGSPLKEKFDPM